MAEEMCKEPTGKVVWPKSQEYEEARLVSNYYSSKNKFPDVVVYCQNRQDVVNAVNWARCKNKTVRIRSGAHNHEAFSTGNGAVVIDVSEMKALQIDPSTKQAVLEAGITNGELYRALYEKKLTHSGGTCSDVGVSGIALSGGMGPLLRREGLTCDTLISFDMVTAEGKIITATADNEHKDLFWACRGGGAGNFGVVVSMRIQAFPADDVTWFDIGWDWSQPVEKIIAAWQNFFNKPDKRWFSHLDIWAKPFPVDQFKKQPVKMLGVFWGTPEQARRELAPLLQIAPPKEQVIETVSWVKAIKEFEDSTAVFITDKPEYKSTGAYAMDKLPADANKIIVDALQNSQSPLLNVLLFSMGGASGEIAPDATAYYWRKAKFFLSYNSQWLKETDDVKQTQELDALRQKLLPFTEGDYIGNPDRSFTDYLTVYYGKNVQRLEQVKLKYDPTQLFQYEQSVPPAAQ